MENKEGFQYSYSAQQQQEVERIRQSYLPKEEDKLERLRTLHRSAGRTARGWAITLGVIGALTMGGGMSLVMTELGQLFPYAMLFGIVLGLLGMVLVALAYPVYNRVLERERRRIAPEILRLSEELLQ